MIGRGLIATACCVLVGTGVIAQVGQSAPDRAASSDKYVRVQRPNQWVFTRFKGTEVLDADNNKIGTVSDLLFDQTGRIAAVIVSRGGLLGIGTKPFALDLTALSVVSTKPNRPEDPASIGDVADLSNVKLKVGLAKKDLNEAPDFVYFKPPTKTLTPRSAPSVPRTLPGPPLPQTE